MNKMLLSVKRLQAAINKLSEDQKIMINTSEWYSEKAKRPITCYTVKQSTTEPGDEKRFRHYTELFKTHSQVQLVLWLRDYWYELNGWEIPKDNEVWNQIKAEKEGE